MQVAELVKDYLAVLVSWPVAIVILVVILGKVFRTEIANLISRVTRIKAGPVDIVSVAREAQASEALRSKVQADVVLAIIRPFVPQLVNHLLRIHKIFSALKQDVRATVYLPWPLDTEHLVQVTPYVPHGPDKTGRLLSKGIGAVGLAFRTGETKRVPMPTERNDFKKKHVEVWGFAPEETEQLQSDRRSYLAIPLPSDGKRLGVTFFDSNDPNAFSDEEIKQVEQQVKQLASVVAILHYQLEALRPQS